MLMVRINVYTHLCLLFDTGSIEHLPYRNTAWNQLILGDSPALKVRYKLLIGDEIEVQIAVLGTGRASIIGRYKAGCQLHRMMLQHIRQHQGSKHVSTNDGIVLSLLYVIEHSVRTLRHKLIDPRIIVKDRRMLFRISVPEFKEPGQMTIHKGMSPGYKLGNLRGNKGQAILNIAYLIFRIIILFDCLGTRIVPLPRIAAQDQRFHLSFSLLLHEAWRDAIAFHITVY